MPSPSPLVPRLPILRASGEYPEWDLYLGAVYGGPLVDDAYPIDLNTFEWFYRGAPIGHGVQPVEASPYVAVAPGTAWIGENDGLDRLISRRLGGYFVQRYDVDARQWQGGNVDGAVGPMQWMEVLHAALKQPTGGGGAGAIGTWYYRARGSGVWLNSGRATRVLRGRNASHLLHVSSLLALQRHGVTTVQAPVSVYMQNNRFEIVDFRHGGFGSMAGGEDKPCVGEYRAGARAERLCICNDSLMATNCAGANTRRS